ncbi:aminoglycoside phosphotransferase family protein [Nonomuraea angiospora]|uniref:aminoglycoside phosphotransferase family protein n=1 Tax=Nonomuraea angiospora TaxID=46172 RepID=UPI0029A83C66|nr:aminoglycoside phosphotransferase family protein [Nonomuraea angiospora]MDX3110314.1 aminoglycoside phosphotransferase family protein [Nonomuraea angiospora]
MLVIVDQDGAVLCDVAGGNRTLPLMRFDVRWPPMDSELTDRVRRELGLTTVVLEPLDFTTVVLLAAGGARPVCADGFAWHGQDAVTGQSLVLDRRVVRSRPPASDWFRPGWFERAESYIDEEIKAAGRVRLGPSRQIKHWSMSAVLRTPTDCGDVYLKAVLPRLAREPDITRYLASLRIAPFATITAMSRDDRWWLAEDFGGVNGWAVSAEKRRACLTQLAMVQKETSGRVNELMDAGCVRLTPASLADGVRLTLARDDIWRAPKLPKNLHRALSGAEADRLEALTPYLVACAERLDEAAIPATIVHRDFHPGNVVVRYGEILLHDWSFATVTNPLFDLASWLLDASEADAASYLDAYFAAWSDTVAPEWMRGAWRLAKPLAAVVEMMKLIELADIVGPDHDFNWLPMTYGWARRLLNAATDPDLTVNGWRK